MVEPGDNDYTLELYVPAASLLMVFDHGGEDCFSVQGSYSQTVRIDLAHLLDYATGAASAAMAWYFGLDGIGHQMIVLGQVENAFGGAGSEDMAGNELANLLSGEADVLGPGAADTLRGGAGNDTLLGGAGGDVLQGDADDDLLQGHAGADTLLGGTGRDLLEGGTGGDLLDGGGQAGDMVSYAASAEGVRITLQGTAAAQAQGGDAQGDTILGVTAITGSALRDLLVDAEKGALPQGGNANLFLGGGGNDRLTLGGGQDTGLGGLGNDQIRGESGADDLQGGAGRDKLFGGMGKDLLTGGSGADRFIFRKAGESAALAADADVITDFSAVQGDLISLSALDANASLGGNQAFRLITGPLTGQAGELAQMQDGTDLLLLADWTGDGLADLTLRLTGIAVITAQDLVL